MRRQSWQNDYDIGSLEWSMHGSVFYDVLLGLDFLCILFWPALY